PDASLLTDLPWLSHIDWEIPLMHGTTWVHNCSSGEWRWNCSASQSDIVDTAHKGGWMEMPTVDQFLQLPVWQQVLAGVAALAMLLLLCRLLWCTCHRCVRCCCCCCCCDVCARSISNYPRQFASHCEWMGCSRICVCAC